MTRPADKRYGLRCSTLNERSRCAGGSHRSLRSWTTSSNVSRSTCNKNSLCSTSNPCHRRRVLRRGEAGALDRPQGSVTIEGLRVRPAPPATRACRPSQRTAPRGVGTSIADASELKDFRRNVIAHEPTTQPQPGCPTVKWPSTATLRQRTRQTAALRRRLGKL